jgi:hypothetical protein
MAAGTRALTTNVRAFAKNLHQKANPVAADFTRHAPSLAAS